MRIDLRPEQALKLWHAATLAMVRDEKPDLTIRQFAILLTVYLEPPPHTVRALAGRLGVTKPVITRALDTMGQMQLLKRRRDEHDRRNVIIQRTLEGSLFLEHVADLIRKQAEAL
jgi:DNA-binding MarR family transcriptional regulator